MSLSCHWDDLTLNSREELIKMFGELELPIFENATKQELVTMLNLYLKNPNDKSIAQMYAKRKKHFRFPFHKFRMFTITLFIMIKRPGLLLREKPLRGIPITLVGREDSLGVFTGLLCAIAKPVINVF